MSDTDAFSKKLKKEKKFVHLQRQTMAAKLKLAKRFKRFNQELRVLLLIIVCFVDLVKCMSPTSAEILFVALTTAFVLLITFIDVMYLIL